MANADIVVVGPGELTLIAQLYNELFRPPRGVEFFQRRLTGRHNSLLLIANMGGRPVGFATGVELKPTVFFSWLIGVLPEVRRMGVASQLMDAQCAWATEHHYKSVRMECHNAHRPILHMAIALAFDIVGIRWDPDRQDNLIICEKLLQD